MPPKAPDVFQAETLIIGSGPGGAIAASLLAEAGRDVLMIEEGPFLRQEVCEPFSLEEMTLKYRNQGLTAALGSPPIQYVEGRCVGGGSEINSGLYHRAPSEALARWRAEYGVEALEDADLAPHFDAIERELSVERMPEPLPAAASRMLEGASRLGWRAQEARRWFAHPPGGPPGGVRQTMTRTYIPRALRAGCRLMPDTRAIRLGREAGTWRVEIETGEANASGFADASGVAANGARRRAVILAKNVFVCGGAIQTPALLRRSGFRRAIGDSLRLHPMIKVAALFPNKVNSSGMGVPMAQVREFTPDQSFGCSISEPPYLALALTDQCGSAEGVARDWERMAVYYAATRCRGTGTVRNLPGFRDPLVRYRLEPDDMTDLAEALARICRLLLAAGATEVRPVVAGAPVITREEHIDALPGQMPRLTARLTTVHLFSSCPMGERESICATDSFGAVRGADNLWIGDASLLCGAPGVNPQGAIMAIVRRNVLHYLGEL